MRLKYVKKKVGNTKEIGRLSSVPFRVECSTFFVKQRVAKASMGLFPRPFFITIFKKVYELRCK